MLLACATCTSHAPALQLMLPPTAVLKTILLTLPSCLPPARQVPVEFKAFVPSTSMVRIQLGAGVSMITYVNTVPIDDKRSINRFCLIRNFAPNGAFDAHAKKAMYKILGEDKVGGRLTARVLLLHCCCTAAVPGPTVLRLCLLFCCCTGSCCCWRTSPYPALL